MLKLYEKDNIYYLDFHLEGKRIRRSTGVKVTVKNAEAKAEAKAQEIKESLKLSSKNKNRVKLSEAINQTYIKTWSHNKDSESPVTRLARFQEFIGDKYLDEISAEDISSFQQHLFETKITPATVNRYSASIRTVFVTMIDKLGKEGKRPYIKIYKESAGRIRYLSKHEEKELFKHVKNQGVQDFLDLFTVLIDTGFRFSEANNLEKREINFTEEVIHCWVNKGDKPRTVPMTNRVYGILGKRVNTTNSEKIFNLSYDRANDIFAKAKKAMGLEDDKQFCIHALRHTYATRLIQAGVDIYTVKELLGHSSIAVTEKYAHLNTNTLKNAIKVLES